MKTLRGKEKLAAIIAQIEKEGVNSKTLIPSLKELRTIALEEKDPLVVKVLRLAYEYLEENKSFDVHQSTRKTYPSLCERIPCRTYLVGAQNSLNF